MSEKKNKAAALVVPSGARPASVISRLAGRFGVEQGKMLECLKGTAFKGGATNEQLMALCIVAEQYGLNPWTREIYAFPDKQNGIVPVVGVDGWLRIINQHPEYDGMDVEMSECGENCTVKIYRKDRQRPAVATEYIEECRRNTAPWASHPRRMLRHKAIIQAARIAFGFAGIFDPDEAGRIVEAEVSAAPYDREPIALPAKKCKPREQPPEVPAEAGQDVPEDEGGADELPY